VSPKKRKAPAGPNFRTDLARRAAAIGLAAEHLDRALVIGQIAGLLAQDKALKGNIAHKGAAMLHLVNRSKRFSRDLDSADIRGRAVDERAIRHALSTPAAKRVVLSIDKITSRGEDSLTLLLNCRPLQGGTSIGITLSINWSEPFLRPPIIETYRIRGDEAIAVPVMDPRERAAEKVRAFLTRGEASDAYDLWWYASAVLTEAEMLGLGSLIRQKLATSRLADDLELHLYFEEMEENARNEWEKGHSLIIAAADKPAWPKVAKALARFKRVVPQRPR